jgi:hypothetical protein
MPFVLELARLMIQPGIFMPSVFIPSIFVPTRLAVTRNLLHNACYV